MHSFNHILEKAGDRIFVHIKKKKKKKSVQIHVFCKVAEFVAFVLCILLFPSHENWWLGEAQG